MRHDTLRVFPSNVGWYAAGRLTGEWLELPLPRDVLWERVNSACAVDALHEEVFLTDWELPDWCPQDAVNQYSSIETLNALAWLEAACVTEDHAALRAAAGYDRCDALDLGDLLTEEDAIPFFAYDNPGFPEATWQGLSREERLGYTMAAGTLLGWLEDHGLDDYFDFEAYGRSESYDYYLADEGYLCLNEDYQPHNLCTYDELHAVARWIEDGTELVALPEWHDFPGLDPERARDIARENAAAIVPTKGVPEL